MMPFGEFELCRPAGWEESDEEEDDICEADFAPMRLPEYSNTWQGHTCKAVHSAWIAFDTWASRLFGLDESKFEWAKDERDSMEQERLQDIANDSLATTKQMSDLEAGARKPDKDMEMIRAVPATDGTTAAQHPPTTPKPQS